LLPVIIAAILLLAWAGASFLFDSQAVTASELPKASEKNIESKKNLALERELTSLSSQGDAASVTDKSLSLNGSRSLPDKALEAKKINPAVIQVLPPSQDVKPKVKEVADVKAPSTESAESENQTLKVSTDDNNLGQLDFNFKDDCWLEVRDKTGRRIFSNSKAAGESLSLQGQVPFSVRLGNVHAVEIKFNGANVKLKPNEFRKTLKLIIPNKL